MSTKVALEAKGDVTHHPPRGAKPRGLGQTHMTRADLARFRQATYRLISRAFLYPDEEVVTALAAGARELRQEGSVLAQFASFAQWSRLLSTLEVLGHQEAAKIEGKYVTMFVVNSRGIPCPPYESVQREQPGWPAGWLLAQVERQYAAAGLAPSPDLGELPDHVGVEMEFMAVLCGREAQAWEGENLAQGRDALRRQKAFLDSHLGVWFPNFARQVMAADSEGIYAPVCESVHAFIGYDRDLLGALLEETPDVAEAT